MSMSEGAARSGRRTYRDAYVAMYGLGVPEVGGGESRRLRSDDLVGLVAASLHLSREEAIPLVRVACEGTRRLVSQIRGLYDIRLLKNPDLVRRMVESVVIVDEGPKAISLRTAWRYLRKTRAVQVANDWIVRDPAAALLGKFRSGSAEGAQDVKLTLARLSEGGYLQLLENGACKLLTEPALEMQPTPTPDVTVTFGAPMDEVTAIVDITVVKGEAEMSKKQEAAPERRRVIYLRPWEGELYEQILNQLGEASKATPWLVNESPIVELHAENSAAVAGSVARADALERFIRAGILILSRGGSGYRLAIAPRCIRTVQIDKRPIIHARAAQEDEIRKIQAEYDPPDLNQAYGKFVTWFDENVMRGAGNRAYLQYVGFAPETGIGKSLGIVHKDSEGQYAVSCEGLEGYDLVFEQELKRNWLENEKIPADAKVKTWKKVAAAKAEKEPVAPAAKPVATPSVVTSVETGALSMRQKLEQSIAVQEQALATGTARLQELEREREAIIRQQEPAQESLTRLRAALDKLVSFEREMAQILGDLMPKG